MAKNSEKPNYRRRRIVNTKARIKQFLDAGYSLIEEEQKDPGTVLVEILEKDYDKNNKEEIEVGKKEIEKTPVDIILGEKQLTIEMREILKNMYLKINPGKKVLAK